MSIAFRFTGILVLALAALAAAFSTGGAKQAEAAGETIDCEIPLAVVCEISHPNGIARVTVTVDFGPEIGKIDVVDEVFRCEKTVTVSWDPIVPNAEFNVVPCKGFGLVGPDGDGGRGIEGKLLAVSRDSSTLAPTDFVVAAPAPKGGPNSLVNPTADDGKMEICHALGNGKYKVMEIPESAWPMHDAHGDGIVIFHIVGGGVVCLLS
jgi:hypothetical protein